MVKVRRRHFFLMIFLIVGFMPKAMASGDFREFGKAITGYAIGTSGYWLKEGAKKTVLLSKKLVPGIVKDGIKKGFRGGTQYINNRIQEKASTVFWVKTADAAIEALNTDIMTVARDAALHSIYKGLVTSTRWVKDNPGKTLGLGFVAWCCWQNKNLIFNRKFEKAD